MAVPATNRVNTLVYGDYPTRTYLVDFQEKRIAGFSDGMPAVMQHIKFVMSAERHKSPIFSKNFGVEFTSLIGRDPSVVRCLLPARVRDALSVDPRILGVDGFKFTQSDEGLRVEFTVSTVFGSASAGVTLSEVL